MENEITLSQIACYYF